MRRREFLKLVGVAGAAAAVGVTCRERPPDWLLVDDGNRVVRVYDSSFGHVAVATDRWNRVDIPLADLEEMARQHENMMDYVCDVDPMDNPMMQLSRKPTGLQLLLDSL